MIETVKRLLVGGLTVATIVPSFAFVGVAPVGADIDSAAPSAALPGSQITISGSVDLLGLGQRVDLCWDARGCNDLGSTTLGLLDPAYSVTVTVPDSEPGSHAIYACETLGGCDSTSIEVLAPTTTTAATSTTTTVPSTTTTVPSTTTTAPSTATTAPSTTTTLPSTTNSVAPPTTATSIPTTTTTSLAGPTATGQPASTSPGSPSTTVPGDSDATSTTAPVGTTSTTEESQPDEVLALTIDNEDSPPPETAQGATPTTGMSMAGDESADLSPGPEDDESSDDLRDGQLPVASDEDGWQLGSNALYLFLWLLVMIGAVVVVFAAEWGLGRRRRRGKKT